MSFPPRLRIARALATHAMALWLAQVLCVHPGRADSTDRRWALRPQDTVWLVSSRGLGCGTLDQNLARLKYWRFDQLNAWQSSNLAELVDGDDPRTTTVVFLHGNRISSCEAFWRGFAAYHRLVQCADERPIRFVVWSWPSAKICGPVKDVRIKAARADAHGFYVAWFLDQLDGDVPVSVWGFSYGARIATGALHLLGGGTLSGRRLEVRLHPQRQPMRIALMAAALDDCWLLPNGQHGNAPSQVHRMLLVNNGCDRVLARYHWLYGRRCCQEALGYVGLPVGSLTADDADKVRQMDACWYVGSQHAMANYLASSGVMARVRGALLGHHPPSGERQRDNAADDVSVPELVTP